MERVGVGTRTHLLGFLQIVESMATREEAKLQRFVHPHPPPTIQLVALLNQITQGVQCIKHRASLNHTHSQFPDGTMLLLADFLTILPHSFPVRHRELLSWLSVDVNTHPRQVQGLKLQACVSGRAFVDLAFVACVNETRMLVK
jgi:hypothetical protein